MSTPAQGAVGAETMTAGSAIAARTLAGMLRSRIERAAEHKSETVSLGQFFADQIHRYLTEAGHGPEHDARAGDVPADDGNPDRDRGRDWGLRARQVHLDALAKRAAGGKWFATTNGSDGLARLDNGTDGMFPLRGEWHEIEFVEALVNAYRSGELATPRADSAERTAGKDSWTFDRTRAYLLAELERLKADLNTIGEDLTDDQDKAVSWLDVAYGRVANVSSVLAATPAPAATPGVPDSLRALSEAASEDWDTNEATPYILGPQIDGEIDRFEIIARGPHGHAKSGDAIRKWQANRMFAVAAVNHIRALIAAQPAGQSRFEGPDDPIPGGFGFEPVSPAIAYDVANAQPAGQAGDAGADGWLPIETAPKDGTRVDLWVAPHDAFANGNDDRLEARWMERVGWVRIGGGYVSECGKPTHWRPRPGAPGKPAPDSTRTGPVGVEALVRAVEALNGSQLWLDDNHPWRIMLKRGRFNAAVAEAHPESAPGDGEWTDGASICAIVNEAIKLTAALAARPAAPEAQGAWRERAADEIDAIADLWSGDGRSYAKTIAAILRAEEPEQLPPADAETKRQVQRAWDRFKAGTSAPPSAGQGGR